MTNDDSTHHKEPKQRKDETTAREGSKIPPDSPPTGDEPAASSSSISQPEQNAMTPQVNNSRLHLDMVEAQMPSPKVPKFIKLNPELEVAMLLHDPRGKQWARIPLSLLDDPEFEDLPDATKAHLMLIMLLVRRIGFNHLPNDERFLRHKIGSNTRIDLELLRSKGFLIAAKRKRTKGVDDAAIGSSDKTRLERSRPDTDTEPKQRAGAVVGVVSKFSYQECLQYANHLRASGQGINNPGGYARSIQRSGAMDAQIDNYLHPEHAPQPASADPNCKLCFGSGMHVVAGKGARKCECRQTRKEATA
jgi:hypothetical protein